MAQVKLTLYGREILADAVISLHEVYLKNKEDMVFLIEQMAPAIKAAQEGSIVPASVYKTNGKIEILDPIDMVGAFVKDGDWDTYRDEEEERPKIELSIDIFDGEKP